MAELTEKQAEVFYFIKDFIETEGYPPSRAEMACEFEISQNAIQLRVKALVKKGALTFKQGKQRSTLPVKGFRVRVMSV